MNSINGDAIRDENEMIFLNIDNATLSNVNFVEKLKKLRELSASFNQIKSIDIRQWIGCDELTHISLQSNPVELIRGLEDVDIVLPKLQTFDIRDCSIEANCLRLLELYNIGMDKSLNLNINSTALSSCLRT